MNKIFTALALMVHCTIPAQQSFRCGEQEALRSLLQTDPSSRSRFESMLAKNFESPASLLTTTASSFTIPVVFHVLHLGGSENISDAQILNAVSILNRDFRKLNADTSFIVNEFKALAADCNIEFRLARLDPDGNCTNGITRHYDTRANWTINPANYVYTWPPSKYLNIYVVRSLPSGVGGYTYLPGTVGGSMDAIVILHGMVGSFGTSNTFNSRALTHEVGHWLNLLHVWGSNNNPGVSCGDDGVNDTPVTKGHSNCNLNAAICTPGVKENVQNYLEYSFCTCMFTQGQRTRMHNCLNSTIASRDNLSTVANLSVTGVTSPSVLCAPIAQYRLSNSVTCVGNPLTLTDLSYNGPVTSWEWSSPSAALTYTVQNPAMVFNKAGLATVKLKAGNNAGSDSISKQAVVVLSAASPSGNVNVMQGFEAAFPDTLWFRSLPKYGSAFETTTLVAASGSTSAWVNNYLDNPNGPVNIYSPAFNLTDLSVGTLSFKYAYAQQSLQNNDRLRVYLSTNCGQTWSIIYSVSGSSLSSTGSLVAGPFSPAADEWKAQNIDISPFTGNSQAYFRFEFTPDENGPGNNFFIDDINVSLGVGMKETSLSAFFRISPNPFGDRISINYPASVEVAAFRLYDISMRSVGQLNARKTPEGMELTGVEALATGVYLLEIHTSRGRSMHKLIRE